MKHLIELWMSHTTTITYCSLNEHFIAYFWHLIVYIFSCIFQLQQQFDGC